MSESLTDLLVTDAQLDAIAARRGDGPRDLVLAELAVFAEALDEVALPPVILPATRPVGMTNARKGGWALSVTVALMVTSSGVAAAVSEDPLAPLHYVTTQVWKIGPHNGGKMPGWELDGAMPISTVPGVGLHGTGVGPAGGAGSGEVGFGQVGTGHGSANGRGPATGDGRGPGLTAGHGGRPPSLGSGNGSNGNSGGEPPNVGEGRDPDNSGSPPGLGSNGPGGPSNPRAPHQPFGPGDQNRHAGRPYHPGYGEVPGTGTGSGAGTGAHQCRIDHPSIPGSSWDSAPLHPCRPHLTPPDQPPSPRTPKVSQTPPPTSSTGPSAAGSSPSQSVTSPTPTGTTPTPKP